MPNITHIKTEYKIGDKDGNIFLSGTYQTLQGAQIGLKEYAKAHGVSESGKAIFARQITYSDWTKVEN